MSKPKSGSEGGPGAGDLMVGLPFAADLGVRVLQIGGGEATLSIPYDARLIGDPDTGVIHGGAVTALLDTCAGAAVMASPTGASGVATLDLRIDYMRAATPGATIIAHASCYRETRLISFVRAVAYHDDPDAPIAAAFGAFTVENRARPPKKSDAEEPA